MASLARSQTESWLDGPGRRGKTEAQPQRVCLSVLTHTSNAAASQYHQVQWSKTPPRVRDTEGRREGGVVAEGR